MKTIHKFGVLPGSAWTVIDIPADAKVVKVGEQGGSTVLIWVELDNDAPKAERYFKIFGTGHLIEEDSVYVGTVFIGPYVWHVYEKVAE